MAIHWANFFSDTLRGKKSSSGWAPYCTEIWIYRNSCGGNSTSDQTKFNWWHFYHNKSEQQHSTWPKSILLGVKHCFVSWTLLDTNQEDTHQCWGQKVWWTKFSQFMTTFTIFVVSFTLNILASRNVNDNLPSHANQPNIDSGSSHLTGYGKTSTSRCYPWMTRVLRLQSILCAQRSVLHVLPYWLILFVVIQTGPDANLDGKPGHLVEPKKMKNKFTQSEPPNLPGFPSTGLTCPSVVTYVQSLLLVSLYSWILLGSSIDFPAGAWNKRLN